MFEDLKVWPLPDDLYLLRKNNQVHVAAVNATITEVMEAVIAITIMTLVSLQPVLAGTGDGGVGESETPVVSLSSSDGDGKLGRGGGLGGFKGANSMFEYILGFSNLETYP